MMECSCRGSSKTGKLRNKDRAIRTRSVNTSFLINRRVDTLTLPPNYKMLQSTVIRMVYIQKDHMYTVKRTMQNAAYKSPLEMRQQMPSSK